MTSEAKIAANRRNAARSTGPRTAAGKARSRRNALWHGLSLPITQGDTFAAQLEALTNQLTTVTGAPQEILLLVAQARLELLRVRQATVETINPNQREPASGPHENLSDDARAALALTARLAKLVAFDRYERRALYRFNKVLRLLERTQENRPAGQFENRKAP
jgi:hypothetical protein